MVQAGKFSISFGKGKNFIHTAIIYALTHFNIASDDGFDFPSKHKACIPSDLSLT